MHRDRRRDPTGLPLAAIRQRASAAHGRAWSAAFAVASSGSRVSCPAALCAMVTVLTTAGIVAGPGRRDGPTSSGVSEVGIVDFLTGTELKPEREPAQVRHPAADLGDVRDRRRLVAASPCRSGCSARST